MRSLHIFRLFVSMIISHLCLLQPTTYGLTNTDCLARLDSVFWGKCKETFEISSLISVSNSSTSLEVCLVRSVRSKRSWRQSRTVCSDCGGHLVQYRDVLADTIRGFLNRLKQNRDLYHWTGFSGKITEDTAVTAQALSMFQNGKVDQTSVPKSYSLPYFICAFNEEHPVDPEGQLANEPTSVGGSSATVVIVICCVLALLLISFTLLYFRKKWWKKQKKEPTDNVKAKKAGDDSDMQSASSACSLTSKPQKKVHWGPDRIHLIPPRNTDEDSAIDEYGATVPRNAQMTHTEYLDHLRTSLYLDVSQKYAKTTQSLREKIDSMGVRTEQVDLGVAKTKDAVDIKKTDPIKDEENEDKTGNTDEDVSVLGYLAHVKKSLREKIDSMGVRPEQVDLMGKKTNKSLNCKQTDKPEDKLKDEKKEPKEGDKIKI